MQLRARLSELERRYLAAAAAQDDNPVSNDLAHAQQGQGPASLGAQAEDEQKPAATPGGVGLEAMINGLPATGGGGGMTGFEQPMSPDKRTTERQVQSGLGNSTGGLSSMGLGGLGLGNNQGRSDLDINNMAEAFLRNSRDTSSLLNTNSFHNPSLLSAGLTSGNEAFRNINPAHLLSNTGSGPIGGPGGLSNNFLAEYQNQLAREEQQQQQAQQQAQQQQQQQQHQFASSLSADPSSALAMQLRERSLANSLAQLSRTATCGLPLAPAEQRNEAAMYGSSAQHNVDLNRFVLQAPQDDSTYFQQRLLPGMSGGSASLGAQTYGPYGITSVATQAGAPAPTTVMAGGGETGRRGNSIADYLKRHLQGKDDGDSRPAKRQC
jgi:hypothetical protein